MSILANIDEQCDFIKKYESGAGQTRANDIAKAAAAALINGRGSDEWRYYMETFFAKTPGEIKRLNGDDEDFNTSDWGEKCQAYIVGNGLCTAMTVGRRGTRASMNDDMLGVLAKEYEVIEE